MSIDKMSILAQESTRTTRLLVQVALTWYSAAVGAVSGTMGLFSVRTRSHSVWKTNKQTIKLPTYYNNYVICHICFFVYYYYYFFFLGGITSLSRSWQAELRRMCLQHVWAGDTRVSLDNQSILTHIWPRSRTSSLGARRCYSHYHSPIAIPPSCAHY